MYWIIEPHVDDAYLSLHEHMTILWADKLKTIVTVFSNLTRHKEAEAYCRTIDAIHINLMMDEGGGISKTAGHVPPLEHWDLNIKRGDVIIFPLGLQHPDHHAVADQAPSKGIVWRYLDTPYYAKQKIGEELRDKMRGKIVVSSHYCSARKWKHIPLFKSQGKYFFHHPPESMPRLELVLREDNA